MLQDHLTFFKRTSTWGKKRKERGMGSSPLPSCILSFTASVLVTRWSTSKYCIRLLFSPVSSCTFWGLTVQSWLLQVECIRHHKLLTIKLLYWQLKTKLGPVLLERWGTLLCLLWSSGFEAILLLGRGTSSSCLPLPSGQASAAASTPPAGGHGAPMPLVGRLQGALLQVTSGALPQRGRLLHGWTEPDKIPLDRNVVLQVCWLPGHIGRSEEKRLTTPLERWAARPLQGKSCSVKPRNTPR